MASGDTNQTRSAAKELLLADYHNFSESLWKNEQTGETRVNWFIGIVTAAAGGLIGLTAAEHRPFGNPLRLIYVASFFALLAFGIITLLRIAKRNETTDGYKRDSDNIRRMFQKYFDDDGILLDYHPFGKKGDDRALPRKLGGLAHTVSTINSLLFAGLAAASMYPFGGKCAFASVYESCLTWTYVAALTAFVGSLVAQFEWVKLRDLKAKKDLRMPTHAGGIVYRVNGEEVQYLLVGPKEEVENEWILPKGHIEHGEEYWQTALREVREETGVVGRPLCPIGSDDFVVRKKRVSSKYYLIETLKEGRPDEKRRKNWFTFEDALKKITHAENKHLMIKAEQKRRSILRQESKSN